MNHHAMLDSIKGYNHSQNHYQYTSIENPLSV